MKHDHAVQQREMKKTGGGEPPKELSPNDVVLDMMGPELRSLRNPNDSDGRSSAGKLPL